MTRVWLLVGAALLCCARAASAPAEGPEAPPSPTYSKDIAAILNKRCVTCHQAGGRAALVPLTTYREVRPWAQVLADRVITAKMPLPAARFQDPARPDHRMTRTEIDLISRWVREGAPEGNPADLPPLPQVAER
jgi:mono/diheme cytochrome c family protein